MKNAILTFAMLVFTAFGVSAQEATPANPNAPEISFESDVVDYGTIEHNADGNREFKFKNTGKEPLIITNAVGSCGCTVPTWPKEPIKPGATAVLKVKYPFKLKGLFIKVLFINALLKSEEQ